MNGSAFLPQSDLGNLERFLRRCGRAPRDEQHQPQPHDQTAGSERDRLIDDTQEDFV